MRLEGSCHCGAVRFSVRSRTPHPYLLCYCSICRKTAGGGGYAINLMGEADSLQVAGEAALGHYQARGADGEISPGLRHFCTRCGSALWVADPRWPRWVYPFASAVDTPLPLPPARVHMMETYRREWVAAPVAPDDDHFPEYPAEAIEEWHRGRGLLDEG